MIDPTPRWERLASSTNDHGVAFVSLARRTPTGTADDYEELKDALKNAFGAVETGERVGPYSVHKYLKADNLCLGVVLDSLDSLELYAKDKRDAPVLEAFIPKLLDALNG
jgi:hypothetical protein